jgi:hypothetical protein
MLFAPSGHAQCPNDNDAWLTWVFTAEGETASTFCIFSGEHNILEVIEGSTYEVSTCGTSWDTQLTIYDATTGALVAYDDDGCGLQSTVTFTAAQNGTYLLLMDDASCTVPKGTECGYMSATLVNMGIPGACANAVVAVSGDVYDYNLAAGNGELNPSDGPNGTPGDEVVYEFTATVSGTHEVTVSNDDGLVDLFVGEVCSEDDFSYIEEVSQLHLHSLDLVAGTTYYFMVDDQNTTANSGTFSITDPNYCGSGIEESHALIAYDTLTVVGNTADLPNCCFFRPSNDATYELVVPETGSLWISACGSTFDTYMYLSTSVCGGTTLAENDDFCGSQSLMEVEVTAGTYYLTLEGAEDTDMGAFEIEVLNTPFPPYSVHSKHASSQQGAGSKYGSSVAMSGDVLVAADEQEHVEVLRKAGDGSWSLETVIPAPSAGISFGSREALATNGEWIAIGAKQDDTYGNNSGAVHMYHYDGLDWQYEGSLSHMAPFGSIATDLFGMALAMDGNRMVVGSRAENGVGAAGAVHYFEYNSMLGMWLESGFIASTHTSGNSTTKFAESVDISGDYMIVGEHRNNTNGNFAGAAYIYSFYNQCWHQQNVFYGHNADDILGKDVAISGATAVAGSPFADTGGLNEAGAVTMYRLLPSTGGDSAWTETAHFAPEGTAQGDWVGSALDIDGSLLAVGVPRDDEFPINGGAGYFLFDCTGGSLACVNEGFACDAMQNDRLGFDVAVSDGLAAIGATLDDNIFEDAGSVYILGSNDIGFECDLTAPGDTETDLISADDSGASASDDTTRNTTPDFDVFLPGGGGLSVNEGYLAQAGDALIFYLEGSGDSTIVILSEDDIDDGFFNFEFVYPGPVLEDGVYTFCSYVMDVFGNMGATDCLTIVVDNEDPQPLLDFGPSAVAGADTTLYLDANGVIVLDVENSDNLSASDNIAMDTIYVDITDFDCSDADAITTVTLTAVDLAGNIGTTTFDVAIEDNIAPDVVVQNVTIQLANDGTGSLTAAQVDNGTTDNCGIDNLAISETTFGCDDVGDHTLVFTATDLSGNTATANFTVTVEDNEVPEANAQDITLELDASGNASTTAAAVDNGSGGACAIGSLSLSQTDFSCDDLGPNTVTLTVTDVNGNVSTATATVTVVDLLAPNAVAQNVTLQLDSMGMVSLAAADVDNGTTENCSLDNLAISQTDFDCTDLGTNTLEFTARDISGNTGLTNFTVTVEDNVAPVVIAQDVTIQLDASGNAIATAEAVDNGSSDACGIASLSLSQTNFGCDDLGPNTVTLTVTDNNGNVSTETAVVTVEDTAPTIAIAQDLTVQLNVAGIGFITAAQADNGSNDPCGIASTTVSQTSFDCDDLGSNDVDFSATDVNGNTATVSFTVTVEDNIAPTITGTPGNITLSAAAGTCSAAATWTDPTVADNCSATLSSSHTSGATFDVGATTVTFTATDIAGNTTTSTFTVTVTDDEDPVISDTPAAITQSNDAGNCSAVVNWTAPTAADNCGVDSMVGDAASGDTFPVGTTTVSYTATDIHGNSTTSSFTVTVTDDEDPVISDMPASITQTADAGQCTANVTWAAPTASDFCGIASFTADAASGDAFAVGTTTVTYTATDVNGNIATGSFDITVTDDEDPAIAGMPSNITQSNDAGICGAAVSWIAPTGSDNCTVASLTSTHNSGDTFEVGNTTVTYTVTDLAGNTATSSFTVTVTDNEVPVISNIPADFTVGTFDGLSTSVVTWPEAPAADPAASDNCGVTSFTSTHASGDTFDEGVTTVTYTAMDAAGNTTTSSFTVTVSDGEAPVISGNPADITQTADAGQCSAVVTYTAPTATDNVAIISFSGDAASGDTFPVGTTTVTYTAIDDAGNTTTSDFTVTITDDEAPAIADTPANITQTADAGQCGAVINYTAPTASDNCAVTSFSGDAASGDTFPVGTTTVTYTAVDPAGNTETSSFTVTIIDDQDPAIAGTPANITQTADAGICGASISWSDLTASDNCSIASFSGTHASGDTFPVGATSVTFTATDVNGNTTTSTFTVTVTDDEDPSISGTPGNITQTADAGLCGAAVSYTPPTAADNCGVDSFTSTHNSGDTFAVGTTTVTYTATDVAGNTTASSFTVTVSDNEQPVLVGMPSNITQSNDAGACSAAVSFTAPTASDNCGIASFSGDAASGDTFPVGTTTVTYTATDIHGNTATGSFTITVTDDEDPVISGTPTNITQTADAGQCSSAVSFTAPTAADNCGISAFFGDATSGDIFPVGTTTVTYTASDIHGNINTASFTITVTDDENPIINPASAGQTYQRDGNEGAAYSAWLAGYGGAAATDNCGIAAWTDNSAGLSDGCGSTGTETVTFTVTDIHSNSSSTTSTFTVIDDFAPSCPVIDLTDGSDNGLSGTDNVTNDDTPTMRVIFTGSGVESAEEGDVVELYIGGVLSETQTVTASDVANGYAEFETGPFADGAVSFSARHIDDCAQASIFAFLNIVIHTTDPSAMADGLTLYLDPDGNASIEAQDLDDGSSDDFTAVDFTASQTAFSCPDLGDNTVTLTVTDIAGNTATATATVTVVDNIDPTIVSTNITKQLDATGNATLTLSEVASITDNCTVASSSIDIESLDCSDVGEVTVTITAADQSGNTSSATATVTVEDNVAPTLVLADAVLYLDEEGSASITASDLDNGSSDACGIAGFSFGAAGADGPDMTYGCDDTGVNTMTVQVEDVNGNVTSGSVNVTVLDTLAPVVNIFDLEGYTLYAGESCVNMVDLFAAGSPWYEATDNCTFDVEILYDEINETGIVGCREFDRRWIIQAVDASGNMASDTTLQHIIVIDTTAPTVFLDGVPADVSIDLDANCNGEMPAAAAVTASATDNCTNAPSVGVVSYMDSAPAYLCGDAGSYTIIRTYMASATDDCGNSGMASATQTVTFNDVTAPQITDSEGIMNGDVLTQTEQSGLFDFIYIPSSADLEVVDACSDASYEVVESFSGYVPTMTVGNYCSAATPAAFLNGDACNGDAPAALVLEGAPFNGESFTIVPGGINLVEGFYDETFSLEVEVQNADGTGGFIWNADYNEAHNWAQWSAMGRGYKKDCAQVYSGQTIWDTWDYFVMQTGGMIGTGIYAGTELSLTHQPTNYYYGMQVGLGANNQNANYGASAWFYWSGQLVLNGTSQGYLGSSGDIMLDLDCTMPWSASYDYTISDACGNTTTFGYSVINAALQPDGGNVSGDGSGHQPFDVSVGGDLKEPIRVTGLQPNPTNNVSQLGFVVTNNMRLRVDLYDMAGQLVQELFEGNAMNDVEYFMTVDAGGLDAGMYQIRISSNSYMAVKKLLVTQ